MSTNPFYKAIIAIALLMSTTLITVSPPAKEVEAEIQIIGTKIIAEVTSYSSDPEQTDDTPDITASGSHVHEGTAACPYRYALGTKVAIAGMVYTCEDRMNRSYPDRFDVWSPTKEAAITWGLQTIEVTIIHE